MIGDLLASMSNLKREADEPLEIEPAIEAVVEQVDREVSDEERAEFKSVINGGWLNQ